MMYKVSLPLLPPGCRYLRTVFDPAEQLFDRLFAEVPWQTDFLPMYGKMIEVPRRIAMFGEPYRYSGVDHPALPWLPVLEEIRSRVELATGLPFNAVLCNLYRDGHDYIGWHSDDDYPHGGQPAIASVSLGAERLFLLRQRKVKKGAPDYKVRLQDGSVLLLDHQTLRAYKHEVPRELAVKHGRINLTFRHIVNKTGGG